jgi:hypothetical protein
MEMWYRSGQRLSGEAGVAIGPILFIIALLAILAAAIAAGSGSFTAGTNTESDRTKASALIAIGENLKVGMDRMALENNVAFGAYTINAVNTTNNNDLFSPTGGAITPPSTSMANQPGTDQWLYMTGTLPEIGNDPSQLALLKVSSGVCDAINAQANGITNVPSVNGILYTPILPGLFLAPMGTTWPLPGALVGCINNTNPGSKGTYFYQVLYIQ